MSEKTLQEKAEELKIFFGIYVVFVSFFDSELERKGDESKDPVFIYVRFIAFRIRDLLDGISTLLEKGLLIEAGILSRAYYEVVNHFLQMFSEDENLLSYEDIKKRCGSYLSKERIVKTKDSYEKVVKSRKTGTGDIFVEDEKKAIEYLEHHLLICEHGYPKKTKKNPFKPKQSEINEKIRELEENGYKLSVGEIREFELYNRLSRFVHIDDGKLIKECYCSNEDGEKRFGYSEVLKIEGEHLYDYAILGAKSVLVFIMGLSEHSEDFKVLKESLRFFVDLYSESQQ